jgi:hypothetical protein
MTFEKSCKFYKNSICTLKDSYCDLNCDQTTSGKDIQCYDEIGTLTQWRAEKVNKKLANPEWES